LPKERKQAKAERKQAKAKRKARLIISVFWHEMNGWVALSLTLFGVTYCIRLRHGLYDAPFREQPSYKAAVWINARAYVTNTGTPKWATESTCCVIESGCDWNTIVIVR